MTRSSRQRYSQAGPAGTQARPAGSDNESGRSGAGSANGDAMDVDDDRNSDSDGSDQRQVRKLAKGLVRMALSCEASRQPLRRTDVSSKILANHPRMFRQVFQEAQKMLENTLGMRLEETPTREKVTIQQRRAAVAQTKSTASSWILISVLPEQYHSAAIRWTNASGSETAIRDAAYTGLYTFMTTVIALNGGTIAEPKMERYLRRVGVDPSTPGDAMDRMMQRMMKEGYLVRTKDNSSGEEVIDYMLGPRAKVEIGNEGVANVVRTLMKGEDPEILDRKIKRSLGVETLRPSNTQQQQQQQTQEMDESQQ